MSDDGFPRVDPAGLAKATRKVIEGIDASEGTIAKQQSVDASIAKQLQRSMELNARMKNRLQALASRLKGEMNGELRDIGDDLDRICRDEDPL